MHPCTQIHEGYSSLSSNQASIHLNHDPRRLKMSDEPSRELSSTMQSNILTGWKDRQSSKCSRTTSENRCIPVNWKSSGNTNWDSRWQSILATPVSSMKCREPFPRLVRGTQPGWTKQIRIWLRTPVSEKSSSLTAILEDTTIEIANFQYHRWSPEKAPS